MSISFSIQEGVGAPHVGGMAVGGSAPAASTTRAAAKTTVMQQPKKAESAGKKPQSGCGGESSAFSFILLGVMFLFFWLVFIKPQQKRQKEHQEMVNSLVKGDVVITSGGIVGKITSLTDKYVTVEVQDKVRIKFLRSSVQIKTDDGVSSKNEKSGQKNKKEKTKD